MLSFCPGNTISIFLGKARILLIRARSTAWGVIRLLLISTGPGAYWGKNTIKIDQFNCRCMIGKYPVNIVPVKNVHVSLTVPKNRLFSQHQRFPICRIFAAASLNSFCVQGCHRISSFKIPDFFDQNFVFHDHFYCIPYITSITTVSLFKINKNTEVVLYNMMTNEIWQKWMNHHFFVRNNIILGIIM